MCIRDRLKYWHFILGLLVFGVTWLRLALRAMGNTPATVSYTHLDVYKRQASSTNLGTGVFQQAQRDPYPHRHPIIGVYMTDFASLQNHQVRLAARPVGMTTRDNWQFTTEAVNEPVDGGILVQTLYLSLDPAMRGWMNEGKSYICLLYTSRCV